MADHDDLRRTIAALRQEVPMRPEWRGAVLREVRARPLPARPTHSVAGPSSRRWAMRPVVAIAAGLMCAVAGGAIALALPHGRETSPMEGRSGVQSATEAHGIVRHEVAVRFVLVAPNASMVTIVGDFNAWNPTATPMRRSRAGLWSLDLELPSGRHTYGFVVDGVLRADPDALGSADEDFGVPSSVVLVTDRRT